MSSNPKPKIVQLKYKTENGIVDMYPIVKIDSIEDIDGLMTTINSLVSQQATFIGTFELLKTKSTEDGIVDGVGIQEGYKVIDTTKTTWKVYEINSSSQYTNPTNINDGEIFSLSLGFENKGKMFQYKINKDPILIKNTDNPLWEYVK